MLADRLWRKRGWRLGPNTCSYASSFALPCSFAHASAFALPNSNSTRTKHYRD